MLAERNGSRALRNKKHRAKVEAIADAAELIIDQRMIGHLTSDIISEIRVHQSRAGVGRGGKQALQSSLSRFNLLTGEAKQQIITTDLFDQLIDGGPAVEIALYDATFALYRGR
jgi:hypothetical protein